MPASLKFVDSIASAPTTLLDVSSGVWTLHKDSRFPPPPLKRTAVDTLLRDGETYPAAAFGNRVLHCVWILDDVDEATAATAIQNLGRELNKATNLLRYAATNGNAVFFRTFRAPDFNPDMVRVIDDGTYRIEVDIPAEPFAYGLRVDVGPTTVTNDPAAGANGMFLDITSVKGDVDTPVVVQDATAIRGFGVLGVRQHGTPSDLMWTAQCESADCVIQSAQTVNPGGGPDAAMSGAGTNNFLRTTFVDAFWTRQLDWSMSVSSNTDARKKALRGVYRLFAVVRRSDATSVIKIRCDLLAIGGTTGIEATTTASTSRQIVDLGLVSIGAESPASIGRLAPEAPVAPPTLLMYAQRVSGTGTLDWDAFLLVPADEGLLLWGGIESSSFDFVIDGESSTFYAVEPGGDIWAGTADHNGLYNNQYRSVGAAPLLRPGVTNRLYWIVATASSGIGHAKASTSALTVSYVPRYLHVSRPTST